MIKFIIRRVLPAIARYTDYKIQQVEKQGGTYLHLYVECLGFTLLNEYWKLSSQTLETVKAKEALRLENPIDFSGNKLGGEPFDNLNK